MGRLHYTTEQKKERLARIDAAISSGTKLTVARAQERKSA